MSWVELEPLICQVGIFAILAMSLNLISGLTGILQLGQAGFFAAGAYAAGIVAIHATSPELGAANLLVGVAAGAAVAAAFSLAIGLPCLRLSGDYLAIATLGFAEILRLALNALEFPGGAMFPGERIGGPTGIHFTETPGELWPNHADYHAKYASPWLVWLAVGAAYLLLRNLKFSRMGRAWMCIREDEIAARSMGIDVPRAKLTAFLLSAALAGAAGALFFHHRLRINPNDFTLMTSITILLMVVLGGMGSFAGSILAAAVLWPLPQMLRHIHPALGEYQQLIYAVLLIVLIRLAPGGLFGAGELPHWLRRLSGRGEART
jgi:branched-chain amino acid transport system permease protein